jgi:hypothetical protein
MKWPLVLVWGALSFLSTGCSGAGSGFFEVDKDGDGVAADLDCDDADASIYPGASEVWDDGIDQDCDGVADVEDSACSADFTLTLPDGNTTTLDGCVTWEFQAAFEYDPDDPPEVLNFTLTLGATVEAEFDCRIELVQRGLCGPGYYPASGSTTLVLMDCAGVDDAYEDTFKASEGYLRIDTIDAGSQAGSFAGEPLVTTLEGHLHVATQGGIDLEGDLSLTLVQVAGDDEEQTVCLGTDCDDRDDRFFPTDIDGDGGLDVCGWYEISAGLRHTCVLGSASNVACWGYDRSEQVTDIPTDAGYTQVSAGSSWNCALDGAGEIRFWGSDEDDQLSDIP